MKRFVRLVVMGGLLLSMTASMNAAESSKVKQQIEKIQKVANARLAAEKVSAGQSSPWLQKTLSSWRSYLSSAPTVGYLPSIKGEGLSVHFSHEWAKRAYASDGSSVDPTAMAFGRERFSVRDLFVASNLLAGEEARIVKEVDQQQVLSNNARHYLYLLANQNVGFTGHHARQEVTFSYDRMFLNNALQFSVDVPLVREERRMVFDKTSDITRSNRSALVEVSALNSPVLRSALGEMRMAEAPPFYETFNDLNHFVHRVLDGSGVAIKPTQESFGIGDVKLQATMKNNLRYVDASSFGARVTLGTGNMRRNVAVWEPATSSKSGATTIELMANLQWHRGHYANPFMNASLGYSLPIGVGRRVPFLLNHDGTNHVGERFMQAFPRSIPFGEVLTLTGVSFSDKEETLVRDVASSVQKVTLHQGLNLNFRIGNVCENCFNRPIVFSFAYDFSATQGHRLSGLNKDHAFATHVTTNNTYSTGSKFIVGLGYRINDDCFINGTMDYSVSGRNDLARIKCRGGLSLRF